MCLRIEKKKNPKQIYIDVPPPVHAVVVRRYCDSRENRTDDIRSTAGSCTWIIIYPAAASSGVRLPIYTHVMYNTYYICLRPRSCNLPAPIEIYEIYERLIFNNNYYITCLQVYTWIQVQQQYTRADGADQICVTGWDRGANIILQTRSNLEEKRLRWSIIKTRCF